VESEAAAGGRFAALILRFHLLMLVLEKCESVNREPSNRET
jgi:hypothetical protein